jgi:hypothetical protein
MKKTRIDYKWRFLLSGCISMLCGFLFHWVISFVGLIVFICLLIELWREK